MRFLTLVGLALALLGLTSGVMAQTPVQVGQVGIYELKWTVPPAPGPAELSRDEFSQPVLSPDAQSVFRVYSNGRIEKRATENGSLTWVQDLKVEVSSPLFFQSALGGIDTILVVDALGSLHQLAADDGRTLQSMKIGGASSCAPTPTTAGLLLVTGQDRLIMLDASLTNPTPIWSTERVASRGMTLLGESCPVVDGALVCHGRSDGKVACYDLASGALKWARRLGATAKKFAVDDVDAGPVFHSNGLYAASVSGGLYRLTPSTGDIEWQSDILNLNRLGANRLGLVALSMEGKVLGFTHSGEKRFETQLPSKRLENLLVGKQLLVVSAGETGLVLLDSASGRPLQATALNGEALSSPSARGRHLVAQDAAGYLHYFELQSSGS